jgi:pimeloyl-ACP methyl ester carboxylesterase
MRCGRTFWSWAVSILILALIGMAFFPFLVGDMERMVLDEATRAAMPERTFIELSDGVTHYALIGPPEGRPIVLIHGFTSPMFVWDRQVEALAGAGFRVLRYDLFGRGYSDRPALRYTPELFDRQLTELLDGLDISSPVDVAGLSMGGAIAMHFMDRHPERVRRFALFAPAGFPVDAPLKYRIIQWPGVGEWLMKAIGDRTLMGGITQQMQVNPEIAAQFRAQYLEQMRYRGYKRALISTLRNNPLMSLEAVYRRVGEQSKAGILFWGTADHVLPYAHHEAALAALPGVQFVSIDGGGHTANYEAPEKVNPLLIDFLKADD